MKVYVQGAFPNEEFYPEPDDDDDLEIVEHLARLLLVLLDRGEHGEGETHEHEAEHHWANTFTQQSKGCKYL